MPRTVVDVLHTLAYYVLAAFMTSKSIEKSDINI